MKMILINWNAVMMSMMSMKMMKKRNLLKKKTYKVNLINWSNNQLKLNNKITILIARWLNINNLRTYYLVATNIYSMWIQICFQTTNIKLKTNLIIICLKINFVKCHWKTLKLIISINNNNKLLNIIIINKTTINIFTTFKISTSFSSNKKMKKLTSFLILEINFKTTKKPVTVANRFLMLKFNKCFNNNNIMDNINSDNEAIEFQLINIFYYYFVVVYKILNFKYFIK